MGVACTRRHSLHCTQSTVLAHVHIEGVLRQVPTTACLLLDTTTRPVWQGLSYRHHYFKYGNIPKTEDGQSLPHLCKQPYDLHYIPLTHKRGFVGAKAIHKLPSWQRCLLALKHICPLHRLCSPAWITSTAGGTVFGGITTCRQGLTRGWSAGTDPVTVECVGVRPTRVGDTVVWLTHPVIIMSSASCGFPLHVPVEQEVIQLSGFVRVRC